MNPNAREWNAPSTINNPNNNNNAPMLNPNSSGFQPRSAQLVVDAPAYTPGAAFMPSASVYNTSSASVVASSVPEFVPMEQRIHAQSADFSALGGAPYQAASTYAPNSGYNQYSMHQGMSFKPIVGFII